MNIQTRVSGTVFCWVELVELLGHILCLCLVFVGSARLFQSGHTSFCSCYSEYILVAPHLHQYLALLVFLILIVSVDV